MTTITEILAEVFNRVKAEHGVTLSRVEFTTGYGALADIEFSATGKTALSSPYGALPPQTPAPNTPPEGATHYGILEGGNPRYYNYRNGVLLGWSVLAGWCKYVSLSDTPHSELVNQLTPLKQSAHPLPLPVDVPCGVTHFGSLGDYTDCFWKLTDNALCIQDGPVWTLFDDCAFNLLVSQLRPI